MVLKVSARNLAFSSLVLVPSVMWMSSQKLARPASASERPPANQSSGSTRWAMTAVTFGALPRMVDDRRGDPGAVSGFGGHPAWLRGVAAGGGGATGLSFFVTGHR